MDQIWSDAGPVSRHHRRREPRYLAWHELSNGAHTCRPEDWQRHLSLREGVGIRLLFAAFDSRAGPLDRDRADPPHRGRRVRGSGRFPAAMSALLTLLIRAWVPCHNVWPGRAEQDGLPGSTSVSAATV